MKTTGRFAASLATIVLLVLLAGAIPSALMALAVHGLFEALDRLAVPRGLRIRASPR